ncbi:chorismate-binding protein [Chryseobacterium polytrichastri]|uniref:Isochorismate synthase n=1 Tax=Chryseobacterium polytrichastri TaxID=1302687 RepID=A0A1M7HDJ5_9FLAO|nr:chorismate-binding protein [Chryseobacterium polytrichastri]SHM26545.1 isochorismate synthase [Chryseobacterium polytrichastri]
MIYFKFPFDEKLYSTDKKADKSLINFHSFDGLRQINFDGNSIEIDQEKFDQEVITNSSLPEDKSNFIAETKDEYLQKLQEVIEVINENKLPKLVLSRRKIFNDFNQIDLKDSFKNLCQTYPNAFRYIFNNGEDAWMGAFSEVLGKFNKITHEFETMSLAGTLPVSEEWSDKEIEEQKPVSSYIRNILTRYVTLSEVKESKTHDHISGNIKHLRTDFKAKIQPEDLDRLIKELHPTPAVCGIPKDFCKENIQKIEKFPREFYAGYIKIETEETIQFFVNLRCAKLYQNSVHLFVGGGITAQSNPEKEWIETELKSEAVLKNLVIC